MTTVEYAAPGGRPLLLDLHRPGGGGPAPAPVVLFVHGGGWRTGGREVFCPTWKDWRPDPFARLVAAGFAVASVDYRLSGEAVFPAQLDDVRAALGYVRAHAADLGAAADRVVAWGESAGGHLAALLGLTGSAVAGVVDWYGPADPTTMAAQARPDAVAPRRRAGLAGGAADRRARPRRTRAGPAGQPGRVRPPGRAAVPPGPRRAGPLRARRAEPPARGGAARRRRRGRATRWASPAG